MKYKAEGVGRIWSKWKQNERGTSRWEEWLAHSLVELLLLSSVVAYRGTWRYLVGRGVQPSCSTWLSLAVFFSTGKQRSSSPVGHIRSVCIQCKSRASPSISITSAISHNWLFLNREEKWTAVTSDAGFFGKLFFLRFTTLLFSIWECSGAIADPCMHVYVKKCQWRSNTYGSLTYRYGKLATCS